MNKKLYLGVDVGTYETKGVLVDNKGVIHSQAAIKHEIELAIDAKTNPNLLPIILITLAAKIVEIAIPTT